MKRSILLVLLPLVCAATAAQAQKPKRGCDAAAVLTADTAWGGASARRDIPGIMALYAPDATQWAPGSAPIVGTDALRAMFQGFFADTAATLTWMPRKVSVARSCELAYTLGAWEQRARNRNGQLAPSRGTYLAVWVRRNGRWLVLEDMFNSAKPPELEAAQTAGRE